MAKLRLQGVQKFLSTDLKGKHACPLWEKAAADMSTAHCKREERQQEPVPSREWPELQTPAQGPAAKTASSELTEKISNQGPLLTKNPLRNTFLRA